MIMQRKSHPGRELRDRHIDFIKINFGLLAALSYEGFLSQGRGMVVVNEEDMLSPPKGTVARIRIVFLPKVTLVAGKAIGEKETGWLDEYDPAQTMLVGYARCDSGFSSYQIHGVGDNTPKGIGERKKSSDSQNPI